MERINDEQIRSFLRKITKDENDYYEMVSRIALTFGLRFSQIGKIFGLKDEEVGPVLRHALYALVPDGKKPYLVGALDNLNAYAFKDYKRSEEEFYTFMMDLYMEYVAMQRSETKEEGKAKAIALRGLIYDIPVARFRKNHVAGAEISDADALAIIRYQIKFFLSPVALCKFFQITNEEYQKCLEKAKMQDPNIENDCNEVLKIYQVAENNKSNDAHNVEASQKVHVEVGAKPNDGNNQYSPFQRF